MGFFSWKYCDSNDRMIVGKFIPSYLLIPQEFGGGHIIENCYDGYGSMGGCDVFEIVAEWNRKHLTKDCLPIPKCNRVNSPCPSWYSADEWPEIAKKLDEKDMTQYQKDCQCIEDFAKGLSDDYMESMYGVDFKRELGILIAGDDEDNRQLKYPIKIAKKADSVYENCIASESDPLQGCY